MAAQLTIIASRLVKEKFAGSNDLQDGVIYDPILVEKDKKEITVKGAIDWTVYNTGNKICYLWHAIPLAPGQSFNLPKSTQLPIASAIKIRFEGDYEQTRNIADVAIVAPSA